MTLAEGGRLKQTGVRFLNSWVRVSTTISCLRIS